MLPALDAGMEGRLSLEIEEPRPVPDPGDDSAAVPAGGVPGLVSVLVPSYNHEKFVLDCLDSVARETYPDIEVILIDDGSRDRTYEIACAWREANAHRFARVDMQRQDNAGLTRTLNRLITKARGEYIALLASDDMLVEGGIAARVDALRSHPQWWAVFGDSEVIDMGGRSTHASALADYYGANKQALSDPGLIGTELVWRWSVPGPVLLMDRRIYFHRDGFGFYPEDRVVEDREFYLFALTAGRMGFVDKVVARYRLHGGNVSRERAAMVARQNDEAERRLAPRFGPWLRLSLRYRSFVFWLTGTLERSNLPGRGRILDIVARFDRFITHRLVLGACRRLAARRALSRGRAA